MRGAGRKLGKGVCAPSPTAPPECWVGRATGILESAGAVLTAPRSAGRARHRRPSRRAV
ncbi:hypothetical protein P7K49_006866 [Saguinus oedipus]|uniref:Uncharacterized protein n=1 Tax=Saguinus oedipus TaxID=9490 RepID=A0ABQ9W3N0_SAGOE|nr:hypothetical protein P7K49_006866 [Saguinus oedipus]